MGAHGTLQEALANVKAYHDASTDEGREAGKSKHKKHKKEKKRKRAADDAPANASKKRKKEKPDKKRKEHKKERKASASDSDDGEDSDSGSAGNGSMERRLERARAAAQAARDILHYHPETRRDLRQLLRTLDIGGALDVSGLPDPAMRACLARLLGNLQTRHTRQGIYSKAAGAPALMPQLQLVFDESAEQLASAATPEPRQAAPAEPSKPSAAAMPHLPASRQAANGVGPAANRRAVAPAVPSAAEAPSVKAATAQQTPSSARENGSATRVQVPQQRNNTAAVGEDDGDEELDYGEDEDEDMEEIVMDAAPDIHSGDAAQQPGGSTSDPQAELPLGAVVGPAMGPAMGPPAEPVDAAEPDLADGADTGEGPPSNAAPPPRTVGPAMPPPELLAAAQEAALAMAEEEALEAVGPVPPEVAAEADDTPADDRTAEVARICGVLEAADRGPQVATAAAPVAGTDVSAALRADPYDVLGVPYDAAAGAVKKRYWRLSLMIHPDKCRHPRAAEAFQAAAAAAKMLQDTEQRAAVDERREDATLRAAAREQAEEEERQRQWRVARGTATAADLAGPVAGPEPPGRGAWMTELPPERRPRAAPSQVSVTSFSQTGVARRGDGRDWTETPAQKLMRLTAAATAEPAALPPSAAEAGADSAKAAATAATVDAYNAGARRKTLVEQHQDRLAAEQKAARKAKKEKKAAAANQPAADGEDWEGKHPWRPFDREKDLGGQSKPTNKEELLRKTGGLTARFQGDAGGGRTFL